MKIDARLFKIEKARRDLEMFSRFIYPSNQITTFHRTYYKILTLFAYQKIKNLIINVPSQHGKSEGSSRLLPAFIHGIRPDTRIAISSYSSTFAMKFNRATQRIIDTPQYNEIFPNTSLNKSRVVNAGNWLRNATEYEVVNHKGSLIAVGRGGSLTGNPVDVKIMDDLYKDSMEANSPVVRQSVIDYYEGTVEKRLHNDSQQLCVFTRWHPEDLVGYFEENCNVITIETWDQLLSNNSKDFNTWLKINFEALKESEPTEIDPREYGEALWEAKHSREKHIQSRRRDPETFECMQQGNPVSKEGLLYSDFRTWSRLPEIIIKRGNYTDTADKGDDYLCSINYVVDNESNIYVTDIEYSQDPMELTEERVAKMLVKQEVRDCDIESNNGGEGFGRNVKRIVKKWFDQGQIEIKPSFHLFHQSSNKESRILTEASNVANIFMPELWHDKYPKFYKHVSQYKKLFKANKYDDAPDVLTGIYERSRGANRTKRGVKHRQ